MTYDYHRRSQKYRSGKYNHHFFPQKEKNAHVQLIAGENKEAHLMKSWGYHYTPVQFSRSVVSNSLRQHQSFQRTHRTDLLQNGLVGSPCSPRDSQESSPTPQFKSINSSVLSFLHSPTLTSIHDHWKNHSLD